VLYGLAENYTQAFGPQKILKFPIDPAYTASKISEFRTTFTLFTLFNSIGLTHELSSEPKPNRSSLFSDHADGMSQVY